MKKQYCMKIHETSSGNLVAACDCSLLGKTFSEKRDKIELVLYVKETFYSQSEVYFSDIIEELKKATMANLVGEKLIAGLLNNHIISLKDVKRIAGIPHIQLFVL